ncbi:universal stress protein [Paractinoplanes abujensis]|uniref:Nucleotide-binding universal stress UspA family protein n=1 Tax=Paractinoplanes abujensis TaxID=882441 RepID=A0A7W7G515_9ACTN|nr:universal stress protein [Actinoplanes abujensis]MBB4695905.1 nucleotide-binding universal stress UspA family protein [Actinoplanes abujensis]GID23495.1 universal stress protein [Actinoplanes abujensis]
MNVREPVVAGVDGSDGAAAAVRWAARHARDTGLPLRVIYAASTNEPVAVSERVLNAAVAEAGSGVDFSAYEVPGDRVPALIGASKGSALLVLGESDRGWFAAALTGSTAVRVVAEAECPVVVVRGDTDPVGPVVVAVDGTRANEPALVFAFQEAARRECALFAVHAWQQPLVPTGAGTLAAAAGGAASREEWAAAAQRLLTEAVAPLRSAFPLVAVYERLVEGPAESVVSHETAGAALVVVGSRGRGQLAGLLLGSTSQALIRDSECPVAIVRAAD